MSAHVIDRLSAYLDGELSVVEAGGVRQHLVGCEACSAELGALAALDRAMRELPANAPAGYFDTFASRVRRRIEGTEGGRARGGLPRWSWALAAALLLAVILPRMPWDRMAQAPADRVAPAPATTAVPGAGLPAAKEDADRERFAMTPPAATPAAIPPPAKAELGARDSFAQQESQRLDEKKASARGEPSKLGETAAAGKAQPAYAEPRPPTTAPSMAEARVANEPQPGTLTGPASAAPAPAAPAPRVQGRSAERSSTASPEASPAQATEAEGAALRAELDLRDEAAAAEGAAQEEPVAKEPRAKDAPAAKRERAAPPGAAAAGALRSLESRDATSLEARRALRQAWRDFVRQNPEDARADEARVQVVALGAEIARETGRSEDKERLRADASAYLARGDARQKERVRALLAPFDRR